MRIKRKGEGEGKNVGSISEMEEEEEEGNWRPRLNERLKKSVRNQVCWKGERERERDGEKKELVSVRFG